MPRTLKTLLLTLALCGLAAAASAKIVNRILAVVNYEIITQGDLDRILAEQIQMLRVYEKMSLEDAEKTATQQAKERLDELIAAALLEQEARKQEEKNPQLQISGLMLDEEIRQFRAQNRLENDADYKKALEAQKYTEAAFRREMQKNIRIRELFKRELIPKLNVTDADAIVYYDQHKEDFTSKEQARDYLREQRFAQERTKYIENLRQKSFVKVHVAF